MTGWPTAAEPVVEPAAQETPEQLEAKRNELIQNWRSAKLTFTQWQEYERDLRSQVSAICFPTPKKGTQRFALGGGYNIKLVYGLRYDLGDKDKVDDDNVPVSIKAQVEAVEDQIRLLGPIADMLCDRLIKWKPELSGSEYEKLDVTDETQRHIRDLIDSILTVKPASPTLEFEEPKAK